MGRARGSEPTHFCSTKMPVMSVKEIRSAVTHMRQYSFGGCGQMARGQFSVMAGPYRSCRLRVRGQEDPTSPSGRARDDLEGASGLGALTLYVIGVEAQHCGPVCVG